MNKPDSGRLLRLAGLCAALRGWLMNLVILCLRWTFPTVPRMDTKALQACLADTNRIAPLLIDVRSRAEYETSFIPGARWRDADAEATFLAALRAELAAAPRPVVVYCSVGYRSARVAQRLLAAGITPVYNLEGSIFAWANEGRPLQSPDGATHLVHPFNAIFGRLLEKTHRAAPDPPRANPPHH